MGAVGCEQLLTSFRSDTSVDCRQDDVTNRDMATSLLLLDAWGKIVLLHMTRTVPRRKETHLTEVSIVGQVELRPKAQDFTIEDNGAGVVSAIPVKQRQTHIDHNPM